MSAAEIWHRIIGNTIGSRESQRLESYGLSESQLIWSLRQYSEYNPYPSISDYCFYLEQQLPDMPQAISCAALLSGNKSLIALADELESLLGAWVPNAETEIRITEIRNKLSKIFLNA